MNKTAIKNYAIWARVNLIEAVKQRAYQYEITKDNITDASADVVSGRPLTKDEKEQRGQLIDQINRKGFDQVMEEVAYTWFNRFIALRFMEVNGYLPTKIRVFTDAEGNFKPEILKEALTVELPVDKSRVVELLEKQENEELYKMLLIAQCNELSNGLPDMFEVISNYTELLFPNNLLKEDSILGEMVNTIPEEDWTDAVQIIGWLYQYYNSELKDETFALLKKNVKISKERIPAATQLFTPDWIVRYMVENSLGRLWYEGHPNEEIKKNWKYYLDEAQQEPEVEEQIIAIREEYKTIKPEDIKVIDPCMGSGHILVYAFEVLMQIYTSAGWSERDAAESILENNLYGLDIDDRAGQLAYFAVMMMARKYNRRILTKNIRPKVYSIQESNNVKIEAWWRLGTEEDIARRLVEELTDAKEYGSILHLSVTVAELQALRKRLDDIDEMSTEGNLLDVIQSDEITRQLYPLLELAEVMVQKYDIIVTNPPYMGSGNMSEELSSFIKKNYPETKNDISTVMMEKTIDMGNERSFMSMINIPVWMFLPSYEQLRINLISNNSIINLVHPGRGIFGSDFGTTTFVIKKKHIKNYKGKYRRLFDRQGEVESIEVREQQFIDGIGEFILDQYNYSQIPGSPIAYWVSSNAIATFSNCSLMREVGQTTKGIITGDNDRFMRLWWEINESRINFFAENYDNAANSKMKWFPCTKGGSYRKWYGNKEYIMDWENNGQRVLQDAKKEKRNSQDYYHNLQFKQGISWSVLTASTRSFRIEDKNLIEHVGMAIFPYEQTKMYCLLGFFNSVVCAYYLSFLSPTVAVNAGEIGRLPWLDMLPHSLTETDEQVKRTIGISKENWDSFETSWDFKKHPLI